MSFSLSIELNGTLSIFSFFSRRSLTKAMNSLLIIIVAFTCILNASLASSSQEGIKNGVPFIVGGVEATPYEFPWIVQLRRDPGTPNSRHSCGGSIVNEEWIVTAAHCSLGQVKDYEIVAGEHNLTLEEGLEQRSRVSQIIVHPQYDDQVLENDVALMKLTTPFVFNKNVQPAPLAQPDFQAEGVLVVAGWGRLSYQGELPDVLMKVDVPVIPLEKCREVYPVNDGYPIFDSNICAGYLDGVFDSCNGDSGGPLMCRTTSGGETSLNLCGLVSWGGLGAGSCAAPNEPGVYTAVAPFNSWIQSIVVPSNP